MKAWFWLSAALSVLDSRHGQMEVACIWNSAASLSKTVVSTASELKASLESVFLKGPLANSNVSSGFSSPLPKANQTYVLIIRLYLRQACLRIVLDGWNGFLLPANLLN